MEKFEYFHWPGHPLSQTTIKLKDHWWYGLEDQKLKKSIALFEDFAKGNIWLVWHINASFDGFLNTSNARTRLAENSNPVIDTLELSRFFIQQLKKVID